MWTQLDLELDFELDFEFDFGLDFEFNFQLDLKLVVTKIQFTLYFLFDLICLPAKFCQNFTNYDTSLFDLC